MREQDATNAVPNRNAEDFWAAENETDLAGGDPLEQQVSPTNTGNPPQTLDPPTGG
jgi:hypothetical protein